MRKNVVIAVAIFTVMNLWNYTASAYEQYFTYPGTRAMGMAGAFIGQANDSSAVWYNPAGLRQPGLPHVDITGEYGSIPKRDDKGSYGSADSWKFFSGSYSPPGKNNPDEEPAWAFGLSYFKPYQISLDLFNVCATSPCTTSNVIGRVDTSYNQISLAFANRLGNMFSWGGTLDYLSSSSNRFSTTSSNGYSLTPSGTGYSAGALLKMIDTKFLDISTGVLWRSGIKLSYGKGDNPTPEEEVISYYLPDRPGIYGAGVNMQIPASFFVLTTNVDYEKVLWSKAFVNVDKPTVSFNPDGMDYTKMSFGGELLLPFSESFSIAIRGGSSESTPDDETKFAKINSTTYGVGLNIKRNFTIDAASEKRELSRSAGSNNSYDFWSVSVSYQY